MTHPIPTVEGEALILRGYEEADFEPFFAFAASDRARFVGGPQTRADSWRAFLASVGHWALRGYGMWIVEHRETGKVAGRVGVILNDGWHEPELAWHIYDPFEGRSIAYAATLMARDYSAAHFGLDGVMSYIDGANTRSIKLAERLGARFEKDVTVRDMPTQMWRHPKVGGLH